MTVQSILPWRQSAAHHLGASGSLYVLLGYLHAAGVCGAHVRWLGRDWGWAELAVIHLLLYAASGLDVVVHFIGVAVGYAASEWQLLELIPRTAGWPAPARQLFELVPRG